MTDFDAMAQKTRAGHPGRDEANEPRCVCFPAEKNMRLESCMGTQIALIPISQLP